MQTSFKVINYNEKNKKLIDNISLSYEERFIRRKKLIADNGTEFLVNLKETISVDENHFFELEDGKVIKVISENSNIPVILVDACDSILEWRNFDHKTKLDSFFIKIGLKSERKITKPYLRKELELIRKDEDEPIEINIIDDRQWIYYKDSALLNRLRYYPIYQLGFIGLFMFIAYFNFIIFCNFIKKK